MIITVTLNPAIDKKLTANEINLGETNKCFLERIDISGKGINVSKAVASLGFDTVATGFMGGCNAKLFTDYFDSHKIAYDFTPIDAEIRTNIKLIEKNTGRETEINENGPVVSDKLSDLFMNNLKKYYKRDDILCISGSMPGGIEPCFYKQIIVSAKEAGMKVVFDSSEECFKIGTEAAPNAIKPNLSEMETYFKERIHTLSEIKEKSMHFINKGTEIVALSMGREGACFVIKNRAVQARLTCKISVRGTIGAGDAMSAALAVSMQENMDFESTVRLCIASASASVMEEGTVPGTHENIERLKHLVTIEEIS